MTSRDRPPEDGPKISEATLQHLLANTGRPADDDDAWKREVLRQVGAEPAPRRSRRWMTIFVPTLAAAAAVLLWARLRPGTSPADQAGAPQVGYVSLASGSGRRGEALHPGDPVQLFGDPQGANEPARLYLYLEERLELACPGDPRCRAEGLGWRVQYTVRGRGHYLPILVLGPAVALTGTFEDDSAAIVDAGAQLFVGEAFHVR